MNRALIALVALLKGRPMPLSIFLKVGDDEFKAEGDFTVADAVPAIKEWGRLIGLPPGQEAIDTLTATVKQSNDALQQTTTDHPKET